MSRSLPTAALLLMGVVTANLPVLAEDSTTSANNRWMEPYVAKVKPVDVLDGTSKGGWVYHHSVFVDETGTGHILTEVGVREAPWADAFGRAANEIGRMRDTDGKDWIVVKLPAKPKLPYDDCWERQARAIPTRSLPVKFAVGKNVFDQLPKEFARSSGLTLRDLKPGKFGWVSAGALLMDGQQGLFKLTTKVFPEYFSDRFGGAAMVRIGRDGLECYTAVDTGKESRSVTLGYLEAVQPRDDPAVFNPDDYVKIAWFIDAKGAKGRVLPERLRRTWMQTLGGTWNAEVGARFWVSQRYTYIYITRATGELRFDYSRSALQSATAFTDEYGPARQMTKVQPDTTRDIEATAENLPEWMWPVRDSTPGDDELDVPLTFAANR